MAVNIRKFVLQAALPRRAGRAGHAHPAGGAVPRGGGGLRPQLLIAGGTQAGKTTLLNYLRAAIPARSG
jgi:pilus assembly protein CpaF